MRHENSQRYAGSKNDNTSRTARLLATRLNPCSIELYQVRSEVYELLSWVSKQGRHLISVHTGPHSALGQS